jgi:nucleoside-diphosphate-sugar epimerase
MGKGYKMNQKRVLITGDRGYIGSVLTPICRAAGHDVIGLDTGFFEPCQLTAPFDAALRTPHDDIRNVTEADLAGCDAVIHLAALSNDPIGNLNSDWTRDINLDGSVRLAQRAKAAGVRRFIFSSSCIMYGASEAAFVTEDSPLDPKTEYARSKVLAEHAISALADDTFSPTFLRNGTIYGLSPRMRFDTVLNDLVGSAIVNGRVVVYSDGTPWRPVVNVTDVARAFLHILDAPLERIHNQAFNMGADYLNHRVIELAETVTGIVPGCRLEVRAEAGADQRTYRTDFSKFARTFPTFEFSWTLQRGAKALYDALTAIPLTPELFSDKRFTRLRWLGHLLESGKIDNRLCWAHDSPAPALAKSAAAPLQPR